mmetsp:Transcript_67334/g.112778  ORF Transcript_67334/g.112778 Transcript_67334/m.112778 type:complete len:83 (+) Transcript_67334:4034-4282(+)
MPCIFQVQLGDQFSFRVPGVYCGGDLIMQGHHFGIHSWRDHGVVVCQHDDMGMEGKGRQVLGKYLPLALPGFGLVVKVCSNY